MFNTIKSKGILCPGLTIYGNSDEQNCIPNKVIRSRQALIRQSFHARFNQPFFLFFLSRRYKNKRIYFGRTFFIINPTSLHLCPIIFNVNFRIRVITRSFNVMINYLRLRICPIFQIIANRVTKFRRKLTSIRFERVNLRTRTIMRIVMVSYSASLNRRHGERFRNIKCNFHVFSDRRRKRVIFRRLLFLLHSISRDQSVPLWYLRGTKGSYHRKVDAHRFTIRSIKNSNRVAIR